MKEFKTPVSIKVNDNKEHKEVLKKLESMGYKWNSEHRPTDKYYHEAKYLGVNKGYISYTRYDEPQYKDVIKAAEFLGKGKECIVIYRNGSETVALDKTTGKKAVAKCSPEDTYDFYTGAQLAFERLTKPAVIEVKRAAKEGEYIKIVAADRVPTTNCKPEYKNGDILRVLSVEEVPKGRVRYAKGCDDYGYTRVVNMQEYVVLEGYQPPQEEKPSFKPFLQFSKSNYGYIGQPTLLKDIVGRPLRIGDTVELYDQDNGYRGEKVVTFTKEESRSFICGICSSCKEDGTIKNGWKVILKRKHEDIADGEIVDAIKYIKKEV